MRTSLLLAGALLATVVMVGCETVYTNQKLGLNLSETSGGKVHAVLWLDDMLKLGPAVLSDNGSETVALHDPDDPKNHLATGMYKIHYLLIRDPNDPGTGQLQVIAGDLAKGKAVNTTGKAAGEVMEGSYSFWLKAPE